MKRKILVAAFALLFASFINVNAAECTENCVAKIGDTQYATIMDAINAVPGDGKEVVIEVLKDSPTEAGIKVTKDLNKNFVVDLKNHTVQFSKPLVGSTGTESQNIHIEKGNKATFKNGTMKTDPSAKMFIQNYCDLTLKDVTIDTTNASNTGLYAVSNNNGVVKIIGNTNIYSNAYAFDMCWAPNKGYPNGTQITVDTTGTIRGIIQLDVWGTFTDPVKSTLTIKNMNHEGSFDVDERLASALTIEGGTYSEEVDKSLLKETDISVEDDGKYIIQPNTTYVEEEMGVYFESEEPLPNEYELEITEYTINDENLEEANKELGEDKNFKDKKDVKLLSLYDLTMKDAAGDVVKLNGKFTITLPLDTTKKFDAYKVIYFDDESKEIVEVLDATVDGDMITFETTHLSHYGVVGYNNTVNKRVDDNSNNPKTADGIALYIVLALLSASAGYFVFKKTKRHA